MCVCMYVRVYACECVCAHTRVCGGQRLRSGVFLNCTTSYFLRQGLLLDAPDLAGVSSEPQKTLLSPSPLLVITDVCHHN